MSSRLPETEIANWAFLSTSDKRKALEKHVQPKRIPGSYEPFRQVFGDVVNKQLPLFAQMEQETTPWAKIEREIGKRCRSNPDNLFKNLEIAKATHDYCEKHKIVALPVDVTSLSFGIGHLYEFGVPLLMRYPDRVVAVFLDLRRGNGLSVAARDWVFSAMHERFRTAYPDFEAIGLEIWRYRSDKNRTIVPLECGAVKFSFDQMVDEVKEIYSIYGYVLSGEKDRRRRSSGGSGSLL